MIEHTTVIRVRYKDTDQMGVVYHAVYLEYFETARTEMLRALGLPYSTIEQEGLMLPVLEACLSMKRPARYDNLLNVASIIRELPTARLRIEYEITYDGRLLVAGHTVHAFVTVDGMKPVKPPASFMQVMTGVAADNRW